MPQTLPAPTATANAKAPPWWKRKRFGGSFLLVSVLLHVIFGLGATYLVVQRIAAKRALAFQGGPPNPSKSQRAVEHRVAVAKQKQQSSAPAPPKRVAVAGLAKVSLPEMPAVPVATANLAVAKLGGMGGAGGFGTGPGTLSGGAGTGSSGGGGIPVFGLREPTGGGLRGTFFDLKQTAQGQPTEMAIAPGEPDGVAKGLPANDAYGKLSGQLIRGGLNEGMLSRYFRGPAPLFTTQVFIPQMSATRGPEAFSLADKVKPKRWMVIYRGNVTPPESGNYRFVGFGDDVMAVRFQGRLLLDCSLNGASGLRPKVSYLFSEKFSLFQGDVFNVTAGSTYPMEILIGEQPGGAFSAFLLLEKEGVQTAKSSMGYPLLPIFKLAPSAPPSTTGIAPEFAPDTPWSVWKGVFAANPNAPGSSLLDQLRKN